MAKKGQKKAKMTKLHPDLCLLLPIKNLEEKVVCRWAPTQNWPFLAKKCLKNAALLPVW